MYALHEFDAQVNSRFTDLLRSAHRVPSAVPAATALFVGIVAGLALSKMACLGTSAPPSKK